MVKLHGFFYLLLLFLASYIWSLYFRFQTTADSVAAQFLLKHIHSRMRSAAFHLVGILKSSIWLFKVQFVSNL